MKGKSAFLLWIGCLFTACATVPVEPVLTSFSTAVTVMGKSTLDIYQILQEEEINTEMIKLSNQETIKLNDFESKILTPAQMKKRKQLLICLQDYAELLQTILTQSWAGEAKKSATSLKKALSQTGAASLELLDRLMVVTRNAPEFLSLSMRREMLLKIMKNQDPVIQSIIQKIIDELDLSHTLINNFYDRQFLHLVSEKWSKETKKDKLIQLGKKIYSRKKQASQLITETKDGLLLIPQTHRAILDNFKNPRLLNLVGELIYFTDRIQKLQEQFNE